MNRIYHIFCALLVLVLLLVGGISLFDRDAEFSELQDRELKSFPKITFAGLVKGTVLEEVEEYYADTFPGREALLEMDGIVSALFDFGDLSFGETE